MPRRISQPELIALCAMLVATVALSIDAMLPALPAIADELAEGATEKAALIVTSFVIGMGVGTLLAGPLSDRYGRKPVLLVGSAIYMVCAVACAFAQSLELLLIARVIQGFGAAGPRIVTLAIARDLFEGTSMARILSFIMMVFTLVPAIAPLMGAFVVEVSSWRMIFGVFVAFSMIASTWLYVRQEETLPPERRIPLNVTNIRAALVEIFTTRIVRLSILTQCFCFGILFLTISLTQQVFDQIFGRAESFPYWFGGIAVIAGFGSLLNTRLLGIFGPARIVTGVLCVQIVLSLAILVAAVLDVPQEILFPFYVLWQTCLFIQVGLTIGNLNSIAMTPVGHIAGIAASVIGAVSTIVAALLAVPFILAFNATLVPMAMGVGLMSLCGYCVMVYTRRGEAE